MERRGGGSWSTPARRSRSSTPTPFEEKHPPDSAASSCNGASSLTFGRSEGVSAMIVRRLRGHQIAHVLTAGEIPGRLVAARGQTAFRKDFVRTVVVHASAVHRASRRCVHAPRVGVTGRAAAGSSASRTGCDSSTTTARASAGSSAGGAARSPTGGAARSSAGGAARSSAGAGTPARVSPGGPAARVLRTSARGSAVGHGRTISAATGIPRRRRRVRRTGDDAPEESHSNHSVRLHVPNSNIRSRAFHP